MRVRSLALPLLVAAGLLALAWAGPALADKKATPAQIKALVGQMGAGDFEEREKASQLLDAIGEPALEPLREAMKSTDPEVRRRATELVTRIEKRTLGASVLRPTRVRLAYKDTPLAEALEDFEKKTGHPVRLYDPKNALKDKKVTLDTGETTYWDALDQLCAAAGLTEAVPTDPAMAPPAVGPGPAAVPLPLPVVPPPPPAGAAPAVPAKPAPPAPEPAPAPVPDDKKPGKDTALAVFAEAPPEVPAAPPPIPAGGGAVAPPLAPLGPALAGPPMADGPAPSAPGEIVLTPGVVKKLPADNSSSVRVRASDQALFGPGGEGESVVVLEMTPEPRLRWQQTVGVRLKQAVDDQGQKLTEAVPAPGVAVGGAAVFARGGVVIMAGPGALDVGGDRQFHPVHLKKGPKAARSLKVLEGVITAKVLTEAEEVVALEDFRKAAGKKIDGKHGATLEIVNWDEDRRGVIQGNIKVGLPEGMVPDQPQTFPGGMILPGGGLMPVPVAPAPLPGRIRIRPAIRRAVPAVPKPPPPPAKEGFAFAADEDKPAATPPPPPPPPPAIELPPIATGGAPAPGSWAAGPSNPSGVTLRDEKGKELPAQIFMIAAGAGDGKMQYQVSYQPQEGLGKPAKLVFKARRVVEVDIPFKLENVPLP